MRHNGNLAPFPHSPLLIKLFIYFDFAFVHEPLVSGQMGLWRLRQWIMQAALLQWWPSYAVLVSPALHFIHFLPMLKRSAFVWSDTFPDSWKEGKCACSAKANNATYHFSQIPWRSLGRKEKHFYICKSFLPWTFDYKYFSLLYSTLCLYLSVEIQFIIKSLL